MMEQLVIGTMVARKTNAKARERYINFLRDIRSTIPPNKWVRVCGTEMTKIHSVSNTLMGILVDMGALDRRRSSRASYLYKATPLLADVTPSQLLKKCNEHARKYSKSKSVSPIPAPVSPIPTHAPILTPVQKSTILILLKLANGEQTTLVHAVSGELNDKEISEMATSTLGKNENVKEVYFAKVFAVAEQSVVIKRL